MLKAPELVLQAQLKLVELGEFGEIIGASGLLDGFGQFVKETPRPARPQCPKVMLYSCFVWGLDRPKQAFIKYPARLSAKRFFQGYGFSALSAPAQL